MSPIACGTGTASFKSNDIVTWGVTTAEAKVWGRNCWVARRPTPELLNNLLLCGTSHQLPHPVGQLDHIGTAPLNPGYLRIMCAAYKTKKSCRASRMSCMTIEMYRCCGPGRQIPWSPATRKDWVLQSNPASHIWWVFTGGPASSFKRSSSSCWDLLASSARATCKVCDKVWMLRTKVFVFYQRLINNYSKYVCNHAQSTQVLLK